MNSLWHHSLLMAVFAAEISTLAPASSAKALKITTSPAGASVEIDGAKMCETPCELKFPGDYFHKPHTIFGSRLEHSMAMKLSKPGFRSREMTLTDGPIAWTDLKGKRHGEYYVLKTGAVEVTLDPLPPTMSGNGNETEHIGPIRPSRGQDRTNAYEAQADGGTVKVESEPAGADIYVDGNFVGQTPAKFALPAGLHHLIMKAQGKEEWERDLEVMKDSLVTLHPVLSSTGSAATR